MAQVVLENIYKSFQRGSGEWGVGSGDKDLPTTDSRQPTAVLRAINLTIQDGEFMVLVGPSGCGKSTLLRLIAGLEELTGGNIWVGDRLINELPPKERDIAMVFQNYALYPHMTVYENLAFGLRRTMKGGQEAGDRRQRAEGRGQKAEGDAGTKTTQSSVLSPQSSTSTQNSKLKTQNSSLTTPHTPHPTFPLWAENLLISTTRNLPKGLQYRSAREKAIYQQVQEVAQILQIETLLNRLPKQLSGGQKQRVALGRAMARHPQVFLMDEPLSNLDAKLRAETRSQIVKLQRQLGTTTIYVTHDQTEAMTMGDRIAVMNAGQIQQIASPLELYNRPANRFVAEFIGSPPMNFLLVQFKAPLLITHPQFRLTLPEAWAAVLQPYDGRSLTLGIRPEHLSLSAPAPKNLPVQVDLVEALGSETFVAVRLVGAKDSPLLQARIEPDRSVQIDQQLWLSISPDKIHLFDNETEQALTVGR
ncbi:ATP-binding cassette domain-containing protein [Kovacikia minuta CCNUW1]|uniref:ABC transporter ATP-binding protein n=1 Tax=Kovacikia minuta TaxID=2931930 RepID=UPI001CD0055D|nr:ATP-binding cassette domain-containing protein [Kovacikia minuta]UBF27008.1 ATP-binding cassette domain-containing protein [Kovacikia minuta CCNUW1]